MTNSLKIKDEFNKAKELLFSNKELVGNSYRFCLSYSLLVEEFIIKISADNKFSCALVSAGSFSRRELAPFSDIDVMFIFDSVEGHEEEIQEYVTKFWDCGIELSHTVREYADIEKFLTSDLHAVTQFFETRFLTGNEKIYEKWNSILFKSLKNNIRGKLIFKFFEDIDKRHKRYGSSPKMLEPNVKYTAGGLRDLQVVEWMFALQNNIIMNVQNEICYTEHFLNFLKSKKIVSDSEYKKLYESYKLILYVRVKLHLITKKKNDRLEFSAQEKIAADLKVFNYDWNALMKNYFKASVVINCFSKTMLKHFKQELFGPISDILSIKLDDDFTLKGNLITTNLDNLSFAEIIRAFYYRGLRDALFDEHLRSMIIDTVSSITESGKSIQISSVFFREILNLPLNVGKTLTSMNNLGVLGLYLSEFNELVGFFQPGVYHCYTADEHTLIAISNLEKLQNTNTFIGKIFGGLQRKNILFLSVLFHDIAKPISLTGHEILGSEIARSIMERLGYGLDDMELVGFLVRHHLTMEQVAFRRNLNDPVTLNKFASIFPSLLSLDLLYLLTYADLSAVSPIVWTQWKHDLLSELYVKTKNMLKHRLTGEELLFPERLNNVGKKDGTNNTKINEHLNSINNFEYTQSYSLEEINQHIEEIESGKNVAVFFKQVENFTSITIITRDSNYLLSKLCGVLAINDLNIHNAKIFTREDGIVIDNFLVSNFHRNSLVNEENFEKIRTDIKLAINNEFPITQEFNKVKSKWWRLENKLFGRTTKVKIEFERHQKFTIIDVFAPDKLGLLYQITQVMHELNLEIYYAKIATKEDGVVDSFYVLDNFGHIVSPENYELINIELTKAIKEIL